MLLKAFPRGIMPPGIVPHRLEEKYSGREVRGAGWVIRETSQLSMKKKWGIKEDIVLSERDLL